MKLYWHLFVVVAVATIKENLCVPAIRPLSQRGIIYPEDNWDDCFLDKASMQPGICKSLEECPEILNKWNKNNIVPKTCYFIKKEQFVCCPIETTTKEVVLINTKKTDADDFVTSKKPSNIFLDIFNTEPNTFTEKPNTIISEKPIKGSFNLNFFLNNLTTTTRKTLNETSTKRPSNIFLDKIVNNSKDNAVDIETNTKKPFNSNNATSSKSPSIIIPNHFSTDSPLNTKRRSELECDLHNSYTIDINGPSSLTNEFPFMAAIGWKLNGSEKIWYVCGGVLISPIFVLTAAHCVEIEGEEPSYVHLGDKNLTHSEAYTIKIKQTIKYPGYNNTSIYNDIALVELEKEVNNSVACLWTEHDLPFSHLTALDYGHTPFGGLGPNQLRKFSFTIIDKKECQLFYEYANILKKVEISDAHLCAGDLENLQRTCYGRSGGPLIMEFDKISYVVGITSFDLGCRNLPPSIYTRVSSFVNWIEEIIWPEIDVRLD